MTVDNINCLYLFTIVSEQLILRKLKYRKNSLNNNVKSYETILQDINGFRFFISLSRKTISFVFGDQIIPLGCVVRLKPYVTVPFSTFFFFNFSLNSRTSPGMGID